MKDREIGNLNFTDFINKEVEIILENSMHYTGKVISVGDDYLKIIDKYNNPVFIVIKSISSVIVK